MLMTSFVFQSWCLYMLQKQAVWGICPNKLSSNLLRAKFFDEL